jgi:tetratricopeptide (TPR) repeat protein
LSANGEDLDSTGTVTNLGPAGTVATRLGASLLAATAFALGLTRIEDPDAWTHLALGREIVRLRAFPASEPFTVASANMPFYSMEWLYEVVLYLGYAATGFPGVVALKAILGALLALILWKDSRLPGDSQPSDSVTSLMIRSAVLLGALIMIRPRMVERPDLVFMVFLGFTVYALNAYLRDGRRRYLYSLPALQILWANVHPSLILGAVPFLSVLGGGLTLRLIQRRRRADVDGCPSPAQLKTVCAVFAAVLGASLVNPYGVDVYTLPLRFATSLWHSYHIVELQPPDPWQLPGPFLVTALLAVMLLGGYHRLPVMAAMLVGPFVLLGLSARRFGPILAVVAAPVLARGLVSLAGRIERRSRPGLVRALAAGGGLTVVVATGLALANAGPFADSRRLPGFGINDLFLPERALRYLDDAGVEGRVFNTFHWGGYLAWRDFPNRVPIIDGRAYADPTVLWDLRFARQDAGLLEQLRARYAFDIAVLAYPPRDQAESDAFATPQWALVYWDDVALVYLRRSSRFATLIERNEYHHVNPARGVDGLLLKLAEGRATVEGEIRRSLDRTPSSIGHMLLGFVKLQARAYEQAIEEFGRVRGYSVVVDAAQGLAMAHWQKGDVATAIDHYRRLVAAYPTPMMLYNLGLALTHTGQYGEAVPHLEQARRGDPQFVAVYPVLMHTYRRLGRGDRDNQLAREHAEALALGQAESHLRTARQLAREGKPGEAVVELEASIRLNPRNPRAHSELGDVYLQQRRLGDALSRQRAALELDPQLAQAHYGLARVYERLGDEASARRHLENYLRLEPASYRAWTVRRALNQTIDRPGAQP